ncbi:tetratricopeptide repeat protein [delta proteobacterium NaphS2]|nr:tetratricopeptide repeat protein [delta proteobacterium NaphS2]
MKRNQLKGLTPFPLLFFSLSLYFLSACGAPQKLKEIAYVPEKDIPKTVAVMPARLLPGTKDETGFQIKPGSEDEAFVDKLVRGVINNQLTGKGYNTIPLARVDQKLDASPEGKNWQKTPPETLCRLLGTNGLIFPEIINATMLKTVAYDEYSVEVRITLFNNSGEKLGSWTESASKKKIAIPTSAISALATIAVAAMDEPAKKHMRLVIYDWGWKISQFIPDSPHGNELPEILSVDTNVDKGVFGEGSQIEVELNAEKGLRCFFDLGQFKQSIPMHYTSGGIYKGVYRVREGEQAKALPLTLHLVKPNGIERTWAETGMITIDAVAPPPPKNLNISSGKQGISLSWSAPGSEDLSEFLVERSEKAVGDFQPLETTRDFKYLDTGVTQGKRYYYRVRSVDRLGNRSSATKVRDLTMPYFETVRLPAQFKGPLVPGTYSVEGTCIVPEGETATVRPGTKFNFSSDAKMIAKGALTIQGDTKNRVFLEGEGWKGIDIPEGGRLAITNAAVSGCSPCLNAEGGLLEATGVSLRGSEGTGILTGKNSPFELSGLTVSGFNEGILIKGGQGRIDKSNITENTVGLMFQGGNAEITNNNIFENRDLDINAGRKLVLDDNYLGATDINKLKLEGDILVASLLNAPYPKGTRVVLLDKEEVTPKMMAEHFRSLKSAGIEAFKNRRFGDAHQALQKALSLKEDREVYLYLAYTQMILGDASASEETLEKGIAAFPYEVRLYQVYARQLAARGENEKALKLVDRALQMSPDDPTLKVIRQNLTAPPASERQFSNKKPAPQKARPLEKAVEGAASAKWQGIASFKASKYTEAEKLLSRSLSKPDRETYLYLIYAQMRLNKKQALATTLQKSIEDFPDEVRFYRLYAKHLADKGEIKEALVQVQAGLKSHPDDFQLQMLENFLKESLEEKQEK